MKLSVKPTLILCFVASLILLCYPVLNQTKEKEEGIMVIGVSNEMVTISGLKDSRAESVINGEIVYRVVGSGETMSFELLSAGFVSGGIETRMGDSGNVSMNLKPKTSKVQYDYKSNTIESNFLVEVHYPLIDRIKGFIKPERKEVELDYYRSYTETFECNLKCKLHEVPDLKKYKEKMMKAEVFLDIRLSEEVLGQITQLRSEFTTVIIVGYIYFARSVDIQPVFIRYTPEVACMPGTPTTATTGGSFTILRDHAIEMWNRCCIYLNFLSPIYINDDDYRVLSQIEEADLRSEYNDPSAIEVFFVEVSDPVGLHGGGVCFSMGTANTQIITYDTNLPINLYNLAHELGHAFGLGHPGQPPFNSTAGSLMDPSGFCADNPALMSDANCNNANNPLFYSGFPFRLLRCFRNTNMMVID